MKTTIRAIRAQMRQKAKERFLELKGKMDDINATMFGHMGEKMLEMSGQMLKEACGHALCGDCGECHEPGCAFQHATCSAARESALFDVADRLGFIVNFTQHNQSVLFEREGTKKEFAYTSQGLSEATLWLGQFASRELSELTQGLTPAE